MNCRHCGAVLAHPFIDLGYAPPSNAYLTASDLSRPETFYPLRVRVCDRCWLVQTEDYADAGALFTSDYAYFSSTSVSWLAHAERYARDMIERLSLDRRSHVIELASNDGYLLRNFVAAGVPCLGIEPTASTAEVAERLGIPVLREFFGRATGERLAVDGLQADLVIGNNVYAHVPDINDFTRGIKAVLKPDGVVTLEFPHLAQLIQHSQFDTVYHEHFSYLSLHAVSRIFAANGLRVWDVETLPTHGGSLRVFGCLADSSRSTAPSVGALLQAETARGLQRLETYLGFQERADRIKDGLLSFLIEQKRAGRRVVAYGAAAKGNTLLNYAGVRPDLLPVVYDAAAAKQGHFMPGSHIPIRSPEALHAEATDYILILPWNLATEIRQQLSALEAQGVRFVTAVPEIKIL